MHWLNSLVGTVLSSIGLDVGSRIGSSLQFFIYDFVKISLLLSSLIFLVSYVQSYFPPERTKVMLGRFHGLYANLMGALLGTVTPFCSCSSIPLFIGFTNAGLPVGVTFSFLISSPLVESGIVRHALGHVRNENGYNLRFRRSAPGCYRRNDYRQVANGRRNRTVYKVCAQRRSSRHRNSQCPTGCPTQRTRC